VACHVASVNHVYEPIEAAVRRLAKHRLCLARSEQGEPAEQGESIEIN
jgi:hypothetical protein